MGETPVSRCHRQGSGGTGDASWIWRWLDERSLVSESELAVAAGCTGHEKFEKFFCRPR